MAVEIGTASNARDLVSKLEKFLTTNPELVQANQAWTVIKDSDGGDDLAYVKMDWTGKQKGHPEWGFRRRFVGHGLDGEDTIVVPMQEKMRLTKRLLVILLPLSAIVWMTTSR